jgi:PAS domain S-box-containing protein
MKTKLWVSFLVALILFCTFFFSSVYEEAKKTAIADLNEKQFSYAKQASIGIDDFFKQWTNQLLSISRMDVIANLDRTGKNYLTFMYELNKGDIKTITRVDANGRIMFTVPFNSRSIGADISGQKHIRDIMKSHQPVVSDVFKSVQGQDMVALHVPVLKNGRFLGTLGVGINFQNIARRYVEGIKIGETGYAWMISRDGIELYCPVPGHMGYSVFDNCNDYPEIIAMAREMIQGKEGITTYNFDQIRGQQVELVKKHAVYMPIRIGQTFWSLVVASSESEVLASLVHFRNNLILIMALFLAGGAVFSFLGLRGWFIIREESKRKQAEAALLESEERFRLTFYISPDAISITRRSDGRITDINDGFSHLTGYAREEVIGRTSQEIGLWSNPEERKRLVQGLKENGYYENLEADFRTKEGKIITTLVSARVILLDGLPHVLSVTRDVSERKKAENALKESEARLKGIIEFLPDATMVIDRDGTVIAWNRAMEELSGVGKEEMLGRGNYEYAIPFYGQRRPVLIDLVLQPREDMEKTYRTVTRQADMLIGEAYLPNLGGRPVYLLNTASPLYDTAGAIIGAIETIRDITEHRKMEEELASEHERLAAILDGIPIPAVVIDRNRTVTLWNRSSELLSGRTKTQMLGSRLDLGFLFKKNSPPTLAELVLDLTDEGIKQKYRDGKLQKSDVFPGAYESIGHIWLQGEERTMSIQAARIYGPQGEVIGAVQTAQDITERIRSQKEQEKLQSQLIQAQKMEAIGTLAGGIAHDFNNILTGIMGYTELYKDVVRDRPQIHHSMEQVLKAAHRAKDLVTQILTFSRKTEREKVPVLLIPIVKEAVKFMRASMPATIEIRQKIETSSDLILADPTQMHQVLMNLCANAGQAMKNTGGVLEIGLREAVIDASSILRHPELKLSRYLELYVRDTGHGIAPENLGRIFEPYFTTRQKGEGTGLGLAVVHGIVKDHGGEIRVDSEPGRGALFTIFLPLMEDRPKDEHHKEEVILSGKGENILFVDDEKMVVDLSREVLETLGYRVVTETDPIRAIEVFRGNPAAFDLVITDKTMPHLTGFDVAREILAIRAGTPIILCSGIQEKGDLERLAALGIKRLIRKPATMSELAGAIREILDMKDQRAA